VWYGTLDLGPILYTASWMPTLGSGTATLDLYRYNPFITHHAYANAVPFVDGTPTVISVTSWTARSPLYCTFQADFTF